MDEIRDTSILTSVREGLGLEKDDTSFDSDIIPHLNGAINTIIQAGAGLPTFVMDETAKWGDFVPLEVDPIKQSALGAVVLYVTLKVRVLFDPPSAGTMAVLTQVIDEQLYRIYMAYDADNARDVMS